MNANTVKRKIRERGGFTLVEMLIVVAIIAVLVAVSIPLVGNSMEKAAHATDAANERSAKAAMVLGKLMDLQQPNTKYFYNAVNGKLLTASEVPNVNAAMTVGNYGKHKAGDDSWVHEDGFIIVGLNNDEVVMMWGTEKEHMEYLFDETHTDLCSTNQDVDH